MKRFWSPITATANPLVSGPITPGDVVLHANNQVTSKVAHRCAWGPTSWLRLVYAFYYDDEQVINNDVTLTAGLELSGSRFFRVTFSGGKTSYTFSGSALSLVVSDPICLYSRVSSGELFWTRSCLTVASSAHNIPGGLKLQSNTSRENLAVLKEASGEGDYSISGTPTWTNSDHAYSPSVILGVDRKHHPSVISVGDSRATGTGDSGYRDGSGGPAVRLASNQLGLAYLASAIPFYGTGEVSKPGSKLADWANPAYNNIRFKIASYFSTVIIQLDVNDSGSSTPDQLKTNLITLCKRYTDIGKNVIFIAMTPRTVSTDAWKTVGNQTHRTGTPAGATTLEQWDNEIRYWENRTDSLGFLSQAIAAGVPSDRIRVWNLAQEVSVTSGGVADPLGGMWKADSLGAVYSGTIASSSSLGLTSFRDVVNLGGIADNSIRGAVVLMTTGVCSGYSACIKSHNAALGQVTHEGLPAVPAVGDAYQIRPRLMSTDGTHASSYANMLMATSSIIDYSKIL